MNVTIELSATTALLTTPETPRDPMRLHWTDYPDAFAIYAELLTDRRVQVTQLRLIEKRGEET